MGQKARQHYIPQFYLKGFTDPAAPQGKSPYVWVYSLGRAKPKSKAPKNLAVKRHFYTVRTLESELDTCCEDMLGRFEAKAAPVLKSLADRTFSWPIEQHPESIAYTAYFIASMAMRVPAVRKIIEDGVIRIEEMKIHTLVSSERIKKIGLPFEPPDAKNLWGCKRPFSDNLDYRTRAYKKANGRSSSKKIGPALENLRQSVSGYTIRIPNGFHMKAMFNSICDIADLIIEMNWACLVSEDEPFVTSDRPVVLFNPSVLGLGRSSGFAHPDVQVMFPITPKACLLLTWEGKEGYIPVSKVSVDIINCRIIWSAFEKVFSSREDENIGKLTASNSFFQIE